MLKNFVKDLKPSSTLAINETSKQLEQQGKKIFKFGFGQSPFKVPEDVVEELKSNAYQNKYLPMQGLEELREAVAKYSSKKKNYNYKAKNVIIGPGSKELMFLLHVIFDGEIILPAPSWVSYAPQAILGRNKIQILQTERENNWFPTGAQIEKIISKDKDKNYLLFLNSPNNPSGQVCNKLEEISEIAKKYNLWILEDACHAPGGFIVDSNNSRQMAGGSNYTDASIFSFHPVKHIATGEGGMITTNNKEIYNKLLLLRTHGITKNPDSLFQGGRDETNRCRTETI